MPPDAAARAGSDAPLDALPCGVLSFRDDGVVTRVNVPLAELLGYAPGEIEGHHVETLLTTAGRIFYQTHFFPLVRLHGEAREIFLLLRRRDGTEVGTLVSALRHDRDGAPVTDCALLEVRERRKYEDELLRARREADRLNAALAEHSTALEASNATLEAQALDLELQQQRLQDQADELEAQREELSVVNADLLDRNEQFERARAEAEDANRAKSQFLATMSHELRTPLNAIGGYVQLLELEVYGPVPETQRGALERISRAQRHLLRLVNDVLNLARIEAGRVEYSVEDVAVAEVVASVLPMIEPQLADARLTIDCRMEPDLVARADRDKTQQIVINLLTNAVKFTPAGGRIAVETRGNGAHVLVVVRDTGVGIPPEKLGAVFEPFVQVEVERARRKEGTGLGLAISRDLARGMGGDLAAESAPGAGSTFTLALPRT